MPRASIGYRTCRRCNGVFPRDQVYTTNHCKSCEPIRRREYLDANPDQRAATNAYSAAYRSTHRAEYNRKAREKYQRRRRERRAALHARGLYMVREVARLLNRSPDTLRHQMARRVLATVHEGARVYVHLEAIEQYRREHLRTLRRDRGSRDAAARGESCS
jgi:hypothetical protein